MYLNLFSNDLQNLDEESWLFIRRWTGNTIFSNQTQSGAQNVRQQNY